MRPQIVDSLRTPMTALAKHLAQGSVSALDGWASFASETVVGPGEVIFYLLPNDLNTFIRVSDLRPMKVSKSIFHTPETLKTQTADAYASTASNDSSGVTMTRTYDITEESENHSDQDVGVEVGLELRQMIGYGGEIYGASGETEITASINTSFNKSWGFSNSVERVISTQIEIPEKTETTLTVTKSVSDLRQKAEFWCKLGMTIEFQIFGYLNMTIETVDDLLTVWEGGGYSGLWKGAVGGDQYKADRLMLNTPPAALYDFAKNSVDAHLTKDIDFNNAVTGAVVLTSRAL